MNKSLILKKKLSLFFLLVFSFILFLNLSYFLVNGERGIISYYKSKNEQNHYNEKFLELIKQNSILENRIERLKPESLDIDYLDELIRLKTGYIANNELVVIVE